MIGLTNGVTLFYQKKANQEAIRLGDKAECFVRKKRAQVSAPVWGSRKG